MDFQENYQNLLLELEFNKKLKEMIDSNFCRINYELKKIKNKNKKLSRISRKTEKIIKNIKEIYPNKFILEMEELRYLFD